jgi:sulfur-oxidizing protein SoxA
MWRNLAVLIACGAGVALAQERILPLTALRSGASFAGADVRAMQEDDVANPGMLWVERGEKLWNAPLGASGKSCASCHGAAPTSMRGVAAGYPKFDSTSGAVLDIEARIDDCRTRRQQATTLPRESDDLLALTAFVTYQSRKEPLAVTIDGPARAAFERGREFYFQRHGQMNLACTHCHDQNWGKRLLAQTMSQGHGTAFPAYRLEWQTLGSLQRRLRACLFGIRAEMPAPGAQVLTDLELYLAWRAQGLPLEAPGVRH